MAEQINDKNNKPLNVRQQKFCEYYVELANGTEAARKAGYKPGKNNANLWAQANHLLSLPKIQAEIERIRKPEKDHHIASGKEVMEFFTKMMNGEIKDAFGLDASNSDRLKAANELAKRTVDIDNREAGKADMAVQIQLDWTRK